MHIETVGFVHTKERVATIVDTLVEAELADYIKEEKLLDDGTEELWVTNSPETIEALNDYLSSNDAESLYDSSYNIDTILFYS